MVEMTRLRLGYGVDPPRRGGFVGPGRPSSTVQPRRAVLGAALRPSHVPQGGDREAKDMWRFTARRVLAMGLSRIPRAQTSKLGMAPNSGPTENKRPLTNKEDDYGDPEVPSSNSQAMRPLGNLRIVGRFLLLGDRPQG